MIVAEVVAVTTFIEGKMIEGNIFKKLMGQNTKLWKYDEHKIHGSLMSKNSTLLVVKCIDFSTFEAIKL